jgi:hypothetical protein
MDEENKDNLQSEALQETPSSTETQVESPQVSDTQSTTDGETTERVYAGKFKSTDELEKGYKGLEQKIGKKTYSEQIGEKILSVTGYSVDQLQSAGYTPEQIVSALTSYDQTQPQTTTTQTFSPSDVLKKSVEESRVARLEFDLSMKEFFEENPEAKEFKDEIKEYHLMPAYNGMSPEEIYESKLKKFVKKGVQTTMKKQVEKERASLGLTNNSVPESKAEIEALKRFQQSRHLDDAQEFIANRLFGKR